MDLVSTYLLPDLVKIVSDYVAPEYREQVISKSNTKHYYYTIFGKMFGATKTVGKDGVVYHYVISSIRNQIHLGVGPKLSFLELAPQSQLELDFWPNGNVKTITVLKDKVKIVVSCNEKGYIILPKEKPVLASRPSPPRVHSSCCDEIDCGDCDCECGDCGDD